MIYMYMKTGAAVVTAMLKNIIPPFVLVECPPTSLQINYFKQVMLWKIELLKI